MTTYRITGDHGNGPAVIASGLDQADAEAAFHNLVASIRVEPDPAPLTPDDGYDFMELVLFQAKEENEGFAYAFEQYGPVFRRPDLQVLENDYRGFEAFCAEHADAIDQWWDDHEDDGSDLYDAHLDAHNKEHHRRRLWAVHHPSGEVRAAPDEDYAHRAAALVRGAQVLHRDNADAPWAEV